jgi:hypothetical protein
LLSVDQVDVQIHINAGADHVTLVLNSSFDILFLEVNLITDCDPVLSQVNNDCEEESSAASHNYLTLLECLVNLDDVAGVLASVVLDLA